MLQCLGLRHTHCTSEGFSVDFVDLLWDSPWDVPFILSSDLLFFVFTTNFTRVTFCRTVNFRGNHPEQETRDVKYLFWITHMNNLRQIFQPPRQLPELWSTSSNVMIFTSLHFLWLSVWFLKCREDQKYSPPSQKGVQTEE